MPIVTIGRRRYYLSTSGLQPLIPGTNIPLEREARPDVQELAAAEAKAQAKEEEKAAKSEADDIAEEMSRIAERLRNFGQPLKKR